MNENDLWRNTSYILLVISVIIGTIQRTHYQFLDELFELFIFHIPTIISFIIYSRVPNQ